MATTKTLNGNSEGRTSLPFTKQLKNEHVEKFAQRVFFWELGYESCEENMIEETALETSLRYCRDKEAAMKAMDREPTTLQKAKQLNM